MLGAFIFAFTAIFFALDIIGTLPLYVSMTHAMAPQERRRIVDVSMLVAFIVAVVFVAIGLQIFRLLGITISDFKMAGGLVLLLISLADLVGHPEHQNRVSGSTGIIPLAVPLITGPAVLTTSILQVRSAGYPLTLGALAANYLLAWGLLRGSQPITRFIGRDGTMVISKIAALMLAAIAVAMMRSGIFEAIRSQN